MGKARQLHFAYGPGVQGDAVTVVPRLQRCDVCKVLSPELFPIFTATGLKNVCDAPGCDYGY